MVVIVAKREFSMDDYVKKNTKVMIIDNTGRKSITRLFKYLLINLNTNVVEKTGYYRIDSESYRNSSTLSPYSAKSYETSYRRIGNQYSLDQVLINDYLFRPQINHISLSGISFQVDSVITEQSKVVKIMDSQADPRKVNYLDYCISQESLFRNSGNK